MFVSYWGLVFSRFLNIMSLELIFGICGCAVAMVALGYGCWALPQRIMFSIVDANVALIWAAELTSYAISTYRRNSFNAISDLAVLTTVYALFRLLVACRPGLRQSIFVFAILGAALAFAQARLATQWFNSAFGAGFTDMSALKALCPILITPLPNDWATTLLLFIPFTLLMSIASTGPKLKSTQWIISAGCTSALLSSLFLALSRGAFVGLIVFCVVFLIMAIIFRVDIRKVLLGFAVSFAVAIIVVCIVVPPIRGEIQQIATGRQTTSQARSTEGRFANWESAWTMARTHPVAGVGQDNFAIQLVPYVGKNPERSFGGQTFNTPLQLFAEQGLVGVVSFFLLLFILLRSEYQILSKSQDNTERCASLILISAIAAVVVREFTYSSLLSSPQASLLMWVIMAIIATRDVTARRTITEFKQPSPVSRIARHAIGLTFLAVLAGAVVILHMALDYAEASSNASDAARYMAQQEKEKALSAIDLAIKSDPGNAYYDSIQGLEQGRLGLPMVRNTAISHANIAETGESPHLLGASIASYRKAMDAIPQDDNYANNLGWLYYYSGDERSAENYIKRAIEINSGEYTYHIGLAFLMEAHQRTSAANNEYSTAIKLNPAFIDSPMFRSLKQAQPSRFDKVIAESVSMLKSEIMRTNSPIVIARLGALLLKCGNSRDAIPYLQKAVTSLPSLSLAWENLGNALRDTGSYQDADAALRKSVFLESERGGTTIWMNMMGVSRNQNHSNATGHAERVYQIYKTYPNIGDDLLPPGLLDMCTPPRR
jgi:tetratricopeptide (TPR) repeat protein